MLRTLMGQDEYATVACMLSISCNIYRIVSLANRIIIHYFNGYGTQCFLYTLLYGIQPPQTFVQWYPISSWYRVGNDTDTGLCGTMHAICWICFGLAILLVGRIVIGEIHVDVDVPSKRFYYSDESAIDLVYCRRCCRSDSSACGTWATLHALGVTASAPTTIVSLNMTMSPH